MATVSLQVATTISNDPESDGRIIKQRMAGSGQGRSDDYTILAASGEGMWAVFRNGFAKQERVNIEPDELNTLREFGGAWLADGDQRIAQALHEKVLEAITDEMLSVDNFQAGKIGERHRSKILDSARRKIKFPHLYNNGSNAT